MIENWEPKAVKNVANQSLRNGEIKPSFPKEHRERRIVLSSVFLMGTVRNAR